MRIFWTILGSITLALLVLFLFIYFKFSYILGRVLSSKFGTKVKIEKIVFDQPKIDIKKFKIHNPIGYNLPLALRVKNIDVNAPFKNYLNRVIHINSLNIQDVEINIEFQGRRGSESNWSYLLGNLSEDPHEKSKPHVKTQQEGKGRYAVIDLLTIQNLRINLITPGQKTQTKVFRNMQFKNIVTKKGDITRRITQIVIYHMIFNYKNLIKFPLNVGNDATGGVLNIFEKLAPIPRESN